MLNLAFLKKCHLQPQGRDRVDVMMDGSVSSLKSKHPNTKMSISGYFRGSSLVLSSRLSF